MKKILFVLVSFLTLSYTEAMTISSADFKPKTNLQQAQYANAWGCSGGNFSPQLSWSGAPKNAKSLAITAYDPDAPTGSGFWHWIVYDINTATQSLDAKASTTSNMPQGSIEAINDGGNVGYSGACPPKGSMKHRYEFTIYALDIDKLPVTKDSTSAIIRFMIQKHAIAHATITGYAKD